MRTSWRKALCSTIPKERENESPTHTHHIHDDQAHDEHSNLSPKTSTKLSLFSSISNPSTPILHVRTTTDNQPYSSTSNSSSPTKLHRKLGSNPSSPRSPFTILKNTFRLTKNGCEICMQSVKRGQGKAIYTAECSHTFHFQCIVTHVRKHQGNLICPVCYVTWKDVPLFTFHNNNDNSSSESDDIIVDKTAIITTTTTTTSAPATPTGAASTRVKFDDKRVSQPLKRAAEIRPYNDDEPILSPLFKFNSIPEVEESKDVEEFQGFFVTPRPSIDRYNSVDKKVPRQVDVKLLPETAVVSGSRSHETYAVALRVKAPSVADGAFPSSIHRSPMDVVTVLDVSGSMTGPKLQMLKRAMRLVISSLNSADRLSIIAFSSSPQRLMPLRRMTSQGQKSARKIVDHLACCQGTSVGEALKKAAKVLEDRREKNTVCSIILLSDGLDDHTRLNQRCKSSNVGSTRFAHIEILINPSGFEVRTHEPDQDAFAKCIGGLLSVMVQDLRVQLGFSSGSAPAEIMAVYSCNGRPGLMSSDSARLGDLYAEEEREMLIELKVPISAIGSHHVMSIRCRYKDPVTQEMHGSERALLVPRPHAVPFTDLKIERLRNIFIYTRAVAESRRLVEHYDFSSALCLLSSARALVLQSLAHGSTLAEEYARGLEGELASVRWKRQYFMQKEQEAVTVVQHMVDESGEPLTPTSAWRAAEELAKVAKMKMSLNRSMSDLHGFENARF